MGGELLFALFPGAFNKSILVQPQNTVFEDDESLFLSLDYLFDLAVAVFAGRIVKRNLDFVLAKLHRLHPFGRVEHI